MRKINIFSLLILVSIGAVATVQERKAVVVFQAIKEKYKDKVEWQQIGKDKAIPVIKNVNLKK